MLGAVFGVLGLGRDGGLIKLEMAGPASGNALITAGVTVAVIIRELQKTMKIVIFKCFSVDLLFM